LKKILFYTDTPNKGGAEKQMLLLAKHLTAMGHAVSLAYGQYSRIKDMHEDFAKWCESIFVLKTLHKHDPRHYFALRKILKKYDFDLLHIHLWNPASGRYGFFAASHMGIPIVTTEHDPFELSGLRRMIKHRCLAKTTMSIVISKDNFEHMLDNYGLNDTQLHLVYNGIEPERFLEHKKQADLPTGPGDIVITCVAELHPRKGHKYLLRAFTRLQKTIPRLQLLLVGNGLLKKELTERYGDNPGIHFLGWRNDIPAILKASDIFVLPSLKEAFGLVILEAMASGLPVIATRSGGIPDIIEEDKSGYLIAPGSSEVIENAIKTVLLNPDQKQDVAKEALKRIMFFTAAKMAQETVCVYARIIS
jgi:glycosyltransferase involved in cell wall biosynthesis